MLKKMRECQEKLLIISSATLVPKTNRIRLFRNLLGFDIQRTTLSLRNIEDFKLEVKDLESAKKVSLDIIKIRFRRTIFVSNLEERRRQRN